MKNQLPEGIYEQIISIKIQEYLAKLDPEKFDIEIETLDADEARRFICRELSNRG